MRAQLQQLVVEDISKTSQFLPPTCTPWMQKLCAADNSLQTIYKQNHQILTIWGAFDSVSKKKKVTSSSNTGEWFHQGEVSSQIKHTRIMKIEHPIKQPALIQVTEEVTLIWALNINQL